MEKYKAIILGAQCSGKTTLFKYLQSNTDLSVSEQDDMLVKNNNGEYPSDLKYKHDVLLPKIEDEVVSSDNLVYFGSYFDPKSLRKAKENGFQIIAISVPKDVLLKRNIHRMSKENYEDATQWLDGELDFLKEIKNQGLVDHVLDGVGSIEDAVGQLLEYLKSSNTNK